jgi:hypothetical protein
MYTTLLFIHNIFRWLVLFSILFTVISAFSGIFLKRKYSLMDKAARIAAATTSHIQLLIGFTLYFFSPLTQYFLGNTSTALGANEFTFFGVYHMAMMFVAIVAMIIGSASAKRAATDAEKFKTTAIYFSIGLVMILCAIPWFRTFFRSV